MRRRSIVLRDGRRLAWREFGDRNGKPCIYTTGLTASGAAGWLHHSAALRNGVRWISVDKPGYGRSDPSRGRQFVHWPRDVAELADQLGLKRFAAAGESGGGPHVLAIAHALRSRISVALVIAGMGLWCEPWMRRHLKNYPVYDLARRKPAESRQTMRDLKRTLDDPVLRKQWTEGVMARASEADRKLFEEFPDILPTAIKAYREALDQGPDAAVEELAMCTRRWGFSLRKVRTPVKLWHGTDDENVPELLAREVAARLPLCSATFIKGEGHGLYRHLDDIMRAVRV